MRSIIRQLATQPTSGKTRERRVAGGIIFGLFRAFSLHRLCKKAVHCLLGARTSGVIRLESRVLLTRGSSLKSCPHRLDSVCEAAWSLFLPSISTYIIVSLTHLTHTHTSILSTPIRRLPLLGGRELNLYHLYLKVRELNGAAEVTRNRQWGEVARSFKLPRSVTSASYAIRQHYMK